MKRNAFDYEIVMAIPVVEKDAEVLQFTWKMYIFWRRPKQAIRYGQLAHASIESVGLFPSQKEAIEDAKKVATVLGIRRRR